MEIKDKLIFKIKLKKEINRYIQQFPFYFYFNILINVLLIVGIVALVSFMVAIFMSVSTPGDAGEFAGYVFMVVIGMAAILRITLRGFWKNIKTLEHIRHGNYEFGVKDYEIDNAVEFIEDLPMKKEDVDRMRIELSFNKVIDVLETVGIINCEKDIYDIDVIFKYEAEGVFEMEK